MVKEEEIADCKREKVQDVQLGVQMKSNTAHRRTVGRTRRSSKGGWTEEQDEQLIGAVKQFNGKNWKKIAECIPDRTDVQCLHRWEKVLNPNLIKGSWTKEEDDCIRGLVTKHGTKNWSVIASCVPGRIGKQCRERWHNHLNPTIRKDAWTREEELILIRCHEEYGNRWAEIAKHLPGRADNSIKNHWNCSVKKRCDSILASVAPSQPIRLGVLNPTELDIKSIAPLEQERTEDKLPFASKECSVNQDTRLALQSFIFQPAFSRARSSNAVVDRTISLENSKLRVPEEAIPTEDHTKYRSSLIEFLKPPSRLENKSPSSVLTSSLFMDSPHCGTGFDFDHIAAASDNSQDTKVLQQKPYNFFGQLMDNIVAGSSATKSCDCDQINRTPCDTPRSSQTTDPVNHSTPPDLSLGLACTPSSTEYFLRIAGMKYKHTPSIIRRRWFDSSKRLFAESPQKDSETNKHANRKRVLFDLNIPDVSSEMELDGST